VGAITGDTNTATTFSGIANGDGSTQTSIQGPNVFSAEAWIQTTTTAGGKILGFGNKSAGTSSKYDRHIYMDNVGRIYFGVNNGSLTTLSTAGVYNDGKWHQIVATLGSNGMYLYVDGKPVGLRSTATSGQNYAGYWRIGGDSTANWPGAPSSNFFQGAIDEVSINPGVLSPAQVQKHYTDSGRTIAP
jgi:hypothetical protein